MSDIIRIKEKVGDLTALFVEDEVAIRESTGMFLQKIFKQVFICSNGEEGLETFQTNSDISIIFSDIKMPKMDGVTMVENILELNHTPSIVFISASRGEHEIPKELNHFYITKPITYQTIIDVLKKLYLGDN